MDERHPSADGPEPGDVDDFGRVYRSHGIGAGCGVLGCLLALLAVAVAITVGILRVLG
ncbi:hypothetical protein [Embleya sp. NBC_00896]|uniref:hypothetical protein n=1 Tax=Embleya sp. NBC_00896 TaxID=2975961 RepID=UPI003867305D|nr:hypothetical protein OG928_12740 [Embleya sp. NBC_00896]